MKDTNKNYDKEKGCGKKINSSIYDTGSFTICGSHILYTKEETYLLRHRNIVLCETCKNTKK